jgi:iron complex outermembrane receptor protein
MINNNIKLFGNVSRSYRVPTLNEFFWNDAFAKGNKNLLPESGWAEEISLNINQHISLLKIDFTSTVFNRIMDSYIQWLPLDNYYTPQNIKQVWSRGLEGNLKLILPIGKWNFIYSGRVNYVLSTNEQSSIINDATLHKQLRYVPKLNYLNQVTITYKTFFISFNQTYTGIRFTENDESNYLLYYLLENGSVGNEFKLNKFSFLFQAQVKNIGNESYQVIQNMPMPGRNFLLSLTIKI